MEKRDFKMHPDLLFSVIRSQAGTLEKAILEGVMNSIDAGASRIEISIERNTFRIEDDGRGFSSRDEIESYFEVFGQPHAQGDALLGRFRMGRGQIFSFGRNVWRSNSFTMDVDVKGKGLEYGLQTSDEVVKGCRIAVDLYDPLAPSEVLRTVDAISNMSKYVSFAEVIVNGRRVSIDMASVKFTFEDDDAYYFLRDAQGRSLDVYNLGVFVRSIYSGEFGVSGYVISKRQLMVNFARNDIMIRECEVFKRISAAIKQHAKTFQSKAPVQTEAFREVCWENLLSANFESANELEKAIDQHKIVTLYGDRHISISALHRLWHAVQLLTAPEKSSRKADKIAQSKIAVVLSPKMGSRIDWRPMRETFLRVAQNIEDLSETFHDKTNSQKWSFLERARGLRNMAGSIVDIGTLANDISDDHEIVDEKKLSKEERIVLRVIRSTVSNIPGHSYFSRALEIRERHIRVCDSELVHGFTDGKSFIALNRKLLNISCKTSYTINESFGLLAHVLIHEYAHDHNSAESHEHGAVFYEQYHNLSAEHCGLSFRMAGKYLNVIQKEGGKLRVGHRQMMDQEADLTQGVDELE